MKRFLCLALGCVMVFMSLVACGSNSGPSDESVQASSTSSAGVKNLDPFGAYAETVTLSIGRGIDTTEKLPEGDTPENNQYTRYVKDKLNIEIKNTWQAATGKDYDQKVNLSIAANDLPDALVVNDTQFRVMVKNGQVADLKSAYETFVSPVVKGLFDKTEGMAMTNVTYDSKMLAIPNLPVPDDSYTLVWMRKDWLDKLGLQAPKTVDDLKNIAKEFIEKDPGGNGAGKTVGMAGPANGGKLYADFLNSTNSTYGFDPIFSAYKAYPGFWVADKDGKTTYGSIQPETKTALATLADMYKQGLIDPQMGVRKDSAELMISGQTGIACGVWWAGYWPLPDAFKNNPKANWQAYMLQDSEGKINNHMGAVSTQYCVVRKDYKNPEAIILLNNLLNRDEGTFDFTKGGIGNYPLRVSQAASDEMSVNVSSILKVLKGEVKPEDFKTDKYAPYKLLYQDLINAQKIKLAPYENLDIQYWDLKKDPGNFNRLYSILVGTNPYNQPGVNVNKVYSKTYSQTKSMETKWANLKKLEDETFLKIIMGASPISEFDKFVENWKVQGGDDIANEVIKEFGDR